MRISYVITRSDTIGGAHVHVKDLANALISMGHEVKVFVGGEGPFTNMLRQENIPYKSLCHLRRQLNILNDFRAVLELKKELADFSPDLITCHSSKAGWIGRIVAKLLGVPAIFTAHGWAFTKGVPATSRVIYKFAERIAAPLSEQIIAVSEYDRQLAVQSKIVSLNKISMIWNGIKDVSTENYTMKTSLPLKLIMVARLDVQKNHRDLFYALEGLKELEWELDLVGDGPLDTMLKDLAVSLEIDDRINFLGLQKNVTELLVKSDIFTLVSNWEGLPLSILEAMQVSMPVIASDVGGVREAVNENVTGFVVPRGDILFLRESIRQLLVDNTLREKFGIAGRARYEEYFSLDRMVHETMGVYKNTLQRFHS